MMRQGRFLSSPRALRDRVTAVIGFVLKNECPTGEVVRDCSYQVNIENHIKKLKGASSST